METLIYLYKQRKYATLSIHTFQLCMRACLCVDRCMSVCGCGCLKRAEGAHLSVAGVTGHCWLWPEMGTGNQTQTVCKSSVYP